MDFTMVMWLCECFSMFQWLNRLPQRQLPYRVWIWRTVPSTVQMSARHLNRSLSKIVANSAIYVSIWDNLFRNNFEVVCETINLMLSMNFCCRPCSSHDSSTLSRFEGLQRFPALLLYKCWLRRLHVTRVQEILQLMLIKTLKKPFLHRYSLLYCWAVRNLNLSNDYL